MKKGFTLVELLVVIGILGILAAGLLAAIDPLEQLKKGRDQNKRSLAVELSNAVTRYYAVFGTMPWGNGATSGNLGSFSSSIALMTSTGELKSSYWNAVAGQTASVTILGGVSGAGFAACFDPESKSVSRDPTTIFTNLAAGYPPAEGVNTGGTDTGFFWCAR